MQPLYTLTTKENLDLRDSLQSIRHHPYRDYPEFVKETERLASGSAVPSFFREICASILDDRLSGTSNIHVLRNCPIDDDLPSLDLDDPVADKHAKKKTFLSEALLAVFAELTRTPLLSYGSRNNGDFFTDVIAINRYSGMQTGFSDSELVYHNDRTAHAVRADYVSLLGLRCPSDDLVYTGFIDGRDILSHLDDTHQAVLRRPYFVTPFDVYSRDTNRRQIVSEMHPILENQYSFRYLDATTEVAKSSPEVAKDALIAVKNAVTRAPRKRHRIVNGDLLTFANQDGLHNRDKIEINDPQGTRARWLLKTYAFRNQAFADRHADKWINGIPGRVAD